MTKPISYERWLEAHEGERKHWELINSSAELIEQENGYYRHADVMFLRRDNPSLVTVIDIGGGPLSLTLNHALGHCLVVDPIKPPQKNLDEYRDRHIWFEQDLAESFIEGYDGEPFDEVWMYNCLQHTIDPEFILNNLFKVGKVLRISEPTLTPTNALHPHTFIPEWYHEKLMEISDSGEWNRVNYDYPYVGGKWYLKRYD